MEVIIPCLKLNGSFTSLVNATYEGDLEAVKTLLQEGACVDEGLASVTPLHIAVYKGFERIAERLLEFGANVNYKCIYGGNQETPLHFAAEKGYKSIVRLLLNHGANVNERNRTGKTPLYLAAEKGYLIIFEDLLKKGATPDLCNMNNSTLLHYFVQSKNERIVKLLLTYRAEVDARNSSGETPLHVAVQKKSMAIVECLLKNGADPNKSSKSECSSYSHASPLCIAVKNKDYEILRVLLEFGGNARTRCNQMSKRGFTILHYAAQLGCKKMVALLINHGADINAEDCNEKTPLYYSLQNEHVETCILLLKRGANIEPSSFLLFAVNTGKIEIVEDLLNLRANINSKDEDGRTALHRSLRNGKEELSKFLLRKGVAFDLKDKNNKTPLHEASRKGFSEIVNCLVNLGSCVNSVNDFGNAPLRYAVKSGNVTVVEILLRNNAEVGVANMYGETPLYCAICSKSLDIISALLDQGANVNVACCMGRKGNYIPLRFAVENKLVDIVKLLLIKGADVNTTIDDGQTVLYFAVVRNFQNIVIALLDFNANVNHSGEKHSLLHWAVINKNEVVVDLLLDKGVDIKLKEPVQENTALHIAAMKGCLKIIKTLLRHGAVIDSRNMIGQTALHIAAGKGYLNIIKTLLKHGAGVNSRNRFGKTALHIAARNGCFNIVKILLRYGADIDSRNKFGRTPLHIASEMKHENVIMCLLDYGADINVTDLNKKTVHRLLSEGNSNRKLMYANVLHILKRHVIKLKVANLYVSDENLAAIKRSTLLHHFQGKCEREINRMICKEITGDVSFYDILTKSFKQVVAYMRNEKICEALEFCNIKGRFRVYGSILERRYRRAKDEKCLIQSATDSLNTLVGFDLPYVVVTKVFSYVGINDLKSLSNASDLQ